MDAFLSALILLLLGFTSTQLTESIPQQKACHNNGTLTLNGKKRTCVCQKPFTGEFCEDYACVNGISTGLQYDANSLFFNKRCLCDPGWTGELCSKSLINRCGANGEDLEGKCECRKNFAGDRCQYVTKCTNGQLYNGRCACHYGWAGDFCDLIICHQGQANETNDGCSCPPKYRGRFCDFCAQASSSPPPECAEIGHHIGHHHPGGDSGPIILAVAITIALVVLGAVFYLLCYKLSKTKKAKVARQTPSDVHSHSQNISQETRPLNGVAQIHVSGTELTAVSEKFSDSPPPPYDTLTPAMKQHESVFEQATKKGNSEAKSRIADVKFSVGEDSNIKIQALDQDKVKSVDETGSVPTANGFGLLQEFPTRHGSIAEHRSAVPKIAGKNPADGEGIFENEPNKIYPELKNDEETIN